MFQYLKHKSPKHSLLKLVVAMAMIGSASAMSPPPNTSDRGAPIADDYPADTSTTGRLSVGGSVTGEIAFPNDADWFFVTLNADQPYIIDLKGSATNHGTQQDPSLVGVYDDTGTYIPGTSDHDSGSGQNSRLNFTPSSAGTHYISAGSEFALDLGTYQLSVSLLIDDYSADTSTTGLVAVGGSVTGEIESHTDADWFAVTLEADHLYQIELAGTDTGEGAIASPAVQIHDDTGAAFSSVYAGSFSFLTPVAGVYYIAASGGDNETGAYTLSVTDMGLRGPAGSEFQANTYTDGSQLHPAVTALSDGGFIVTWHSWSQDGDGSGVYGKLYDASGNERTPPAGATPGDGNEFRINTFTDGFQQSPSVTALSDGGFIVTWQSNGQDGFGRGVYGKRYDASGNEVSPPADIDTDDALGNEFRINTYTDYNQWYPAVTALSDGGFIVTWGSHGQDGSDWGVYGKLYDASGNEVTPPAGATPGDGNEFRINTHTDGSQYRPAVTALSDGGFLVTWSSNGQDGSDSGVYGQRYDASGNEVSPPADIDTDDALGNEFRINTYTDNSQYSPAVTALSDGGFIVTWQSDGLDGSLYGVYGKRYDASGNEVAPPAGIDTDDAEGNEFRINTYTDISQENSAVTALSDGGFIVTWDSGVWFLEDSVGQDGSWTGVYGKRYDASGNELTPPAGATLGDGNEFLINTHTAGSQENSAVTALSDGGFLVTWSSNGQDGSYSGVYGQRFDKDGRKVHGAPPYALSFTEAASGELSNETSLVWDADIGTIVGNLTATDPEGGSLNYALMAIDDADVADDSAADTDSDGLNGLFAVSEAGLVSLAGDWSANDTVRYALTVRVTDEDGNIYDGTVYVIKNFPPHSLGWGSFSGDRWLPYIGISSDIGTIVGTLTAIDPEGGPLSFELLDVYDSRWYPFAPDPGGNSDGLNGLFAVSGDGRVTVAGDLSAPDLSYYNLTVRVSDEEGNTYDSTTTIGIGHTPWD